ncbi:MAG: ATP-binding protein [Bacteroidota bacterium]
MLYSIAFISLVTIGFIFRSQRLKTVQKKAAQLQELTRIKNESFDNITHELRSPLANILGMNKQIITPGQLSHDYIATIIEKNGRTLLYRINQLLDLTKSETGKLSLSYIQGDIITYLDAIIKRFYPLAAAKNIKLHFESEWEVESLTMDYDPDKLLSIIANLLTNALKYTQEKGKVTLHAGIVKKRDKKILQLKVKDTGIGIPADKIPYIFDRFYQVNTTNQIHKGTGIGLALAKEFTELMKGTISVKSEVDKGTEFTVRLPISYSASTSGAPGEDTVKEKLTLYALGIHQPSNRKKEYSVVTDMPIVLIIEDDPDMGEVLHAFLRDTYSLQFAANGKEGIAKAIDFIPDIILSDVVMPEKNGFEVCEAIKEDKRTSHIPVILLTAMADENTKYEGLERGAYHFLTKPVDKKELLVKLRNLLEHRNRIKKRYSIFAPPARAEDKNFQREVHFMQEFKQKVAENYHKTAFGAEPLAALLNMTRDQLYRKFKALTDEYTPAAYIKTFRLNKAKELLITTDSYSYTISEIAFKVGYGDLPAFTRAFKRTFGMSPGSFRKSYHNSQKDD